MAFDNRFTVIAPPLPETYFPGKWSPIRVEDPTQSSPQGLWGPPGRNMWHWDTLREWIRQVELQCRCASVALHRRLLAVYGSRVKVTMIEPSSSIVVRSEHQFNQQQTDRMALRLHMYELVWDALDYTREFRSTGGELYSAADDKLKEYRKRTREARTHLPPRARVRADDAPLHGLIGGQPISPADRFGQYLGFLDIRPWYDDKDGRPLALGLLAPPRRYMLDPRAYVITGDYSPIFGGPPFASTVYCQHDEKTSGGRCAQAALVMGLGMLSDRGARVEGSYGITYRAWVHGRPPSAKPEHGRATHPPVPKASDVPSECLRRQRPKSGLQLDDPQSCLGIAGLTPEQCRNLLLGPYKNPRERAGEMRVSPDLVQLREPASGAAGSFEDRLARRLMEAYVSARFPVILFVDAKLWMHGVPGIEEIPSAGHAVTVIGFRRWGRDRVSTRPGEPDEVSHAFITHDPGHRPFFERPDDACMTAAWAYDADARHAKGRLRKLHFLGLADQEIAIHPHGCVRYLRGVTADGLVPQGVNQPVHAKEFHRYEEPETNEIRRFRIRLANSDDLIQMFGNELPDDAARVQFLAQPRAMSRTPGRYWCVLGYVDGRLRDIWAFAADRALLPANLDALWPAPHPFWFESGRGWMPPAEEPHRASDPDKAAARARKRALQEQARRRPNPKVPDVPKKAEPLTPSVITSCSPRDLRYLVSELTAVDRLSHFDLFVFRETDLIAFREWLRRQTGAGNLMGRLASEPQGGAFASAANLVGGPDTRTPADRTELRKQLIEWLADELRVFRRANGKVLSFAAFATYFPDITAADNHRRALARRALTETILLGLALHNDSDHHDLIPKPKRPVIELVCGTKVDKCECDECRARGRCFVSTDASKIELLLGELVLVVDAVLQTATARGWKDRRFALGLELEPGDAYVLRDAPLLANLLRELRATRPPEPAGSGAASEPARYKYEVSGGDGTVEPLSRYVGLNLDIAHMLSAGVSANDLVPWKDAIVHSHISDLPGIHSRDQVPASFTFPRYRRGEAPDGWATYAPYVALLRGCGRAPSADWPGYSGACALELEGCGRIDWVHRGVSWMRRLSELD